MRKRAVQQVEAGQSPEVVIRVLGFHRSCIYEWIAKYREGGLEALETNKITGRPTKLTGKQIGKLYRIITENNPLQLKFRFALWTLKMIRKVIWDEFQVKLSEVSVGRLLKKLGLRPKKPLHRAYEQDPKQVQTWKESVYPEIRKQAKEVGAQIYFADESGIRSDSHYGTTWAPIGQTPVVKSTGNRFGLNLISAVSPQGEMRFMTVEGGFTADRFIEFLKRLMHGTDKPIYLIVDGHPAHKAKKVHKFVQSTEGKLRLFFLPPYSPELNPDEQVWNHLKRNKLGKSIIQTKEELKNKAIAWMQELQKTPEKIRRFFYHPDLQYIVN